MTHSKVLVHGLYGRTSIYVREVLKQFCQQLFQLHITIKIAKEWSTNLPEVLHAETFDRVNVSNILDHGETLQSLLYFLAFLLRPFENPHAILVASL